MPYTDEEKNKKCKHEYYLKNKKLVRKRSDNYRQLKREMLKIVTADLSCVSCGEDERICLDFHHKNPNNKLRTVSRMISGQWGFLATIQEIEKCICVCSNCHRKIHADLLDDSELPTIKIDVEEYLKENGNPDYDKIRVKVNKDT